jgi:AcrR family transcriptional regulator
MKNEVPAAPAPRSRAGRQRSARRAEGAAEVEARRGRKGDKTRQRFLEAARSVFERDGFVDARVADIADAAGAAHGSFYSYFESKEDVFRAVVELMLDELDVQTRRHDEGVDDPYELIVISNANLYRLWTENKDLLTTLDQVAGIYPEFNRKLAQLRAAFIERYVEVLRNLQAEKKVYADLDPFHTAATLSAMLEQAMRLWVGKGDWHDPKVALETLNKMWARSIGLSVPAKYLKNPGARRSSRK